MSTRVTVVIASRDRREQLLATVDRHRALPERPPVIVVDDGSTDGSASAVSRTGVSVIRLGSSVGGAARNVGVRAAATPYVALTDDDAWWRPGALDRAVAVLDAHPRVAVVQAHVLVGAAERDDPTCVAMARSGLVPAPDLPGHPIVSFVACSVVVRREAFLACGGFLARLGVGGEEELLSWDLVSAGWQLSYVPEVVAHHHPERVPGGRPVRRETTLRNALWTIWLRRPFASAVRVSARRLAGASRDRTTLRAVVRAVAGGGWVLRERRVSPPDVEFALRRLER
jgi:GT2 family glycosyltransferase